MKAHKITNARRGHRLTAKQKIIAGIAAIVLLPFAAAALVGVGLAATGHGNSMATHGQSGAYSDCLTLASKDGFAPEICEGLSPNSQLAKTDCSHDPQLRKDDPAYCKSN